MTNRPRFRHLGVGESRALLRRHRVGRIAFSFRDRVDIEPISYVPSGNWLYARTAAGTKLRQVRHNPWVAFQVDEVEGPFDWRSVVVQGTAYFIPDDGPDRARALRTIRKLDPRILTASDPVPERTVLFRIHVREITGRSASSV